MNRHSARICSALACVAALFLASCINVEQDIWINEDGSGRVVVDMGISKQAEEMMQGFGEGLAEGLTEGLGGDAADAQPPGDLFDTEEMQLEIRKSEHVKSAKVTSKTDDKYTHIIYDIELKDITKLGEVQGLISEGGPMGGDSGPMSDGDFSLTKLPNGNYKLSAKMGEEPPAGEEAPNAMAIGMMKSMVGDAAFTISVHAKPVKHNGIVEDGAVVWTSPLADIMGGKILNIEAEFAPGGSAGGSSMALWITLAAIVAVAAVVFFLLQSQKPKLA